jgi:hypothetical protein
MALARDVYRSLEDIVGTKYISEDPAVLDSYRYSLSQCSSHLGPFYDTYTPRGEAVLLPASAEEVQAIVRLCNTYKIKVKASSTFWSAMGYPSNDNTIQLDMHRMDRILEIDEKNMFAVIEPHVVGGALQAEAMKKGLNTHLIGSGAASSPLAVATSYQGSGPDAIFMGYSPENLLGVEWVMPDGEMVRTGSLGSGSGWFAADGPGPGVRGLIRGAVGAKGGMGVFTKCALKLYPWPGPASIPVEGIAPAYKAILPENFRAYSLAFPSWQAYGDFAHKFWDAGIGYIAHKQYNMFGRTNKTAMIKILTDHTKTLSDLEDMLKDPENIRLSKENARDFQLVLVGMTPGDMEWQEKALNEMLAETGGWKEAFMNEPEIEKWALLYFLKMGHKNLNQVYGGTSDSGNGLIGPPSFGTPQIEEVVKFREGWEMKGAVVSGGGDCAMGPVAGMGGGGITAFDNFVYFDPFDRESTEGAFELYEASAKMMRENRRGPEFGRVNALARGADGKSLPKEVREKALSAAPHATGLRYMGKFKQTFDPNDIGDTYYLYLDE